MNRKKLIINIDGPRGIGKSTQIGMLQTFFVGKGLNVSVDISSRSIKDKIEHAVDMLSRKNQDIVINEGSFLRILAEDFVSGMSQDKVLEKHRKLIELNEMTRHNYKVVNIIMASERTEELCERISKFNKLTNSSVDIPDYKKEAEILNQIVGFERSMITLNADTKVIYVDTDSSMLEVTEVITDVISAFL